MERLKLMACWLAICIFCCGCGFLGDQNYFCDIENVESIQIVELDTYVEGEYRYEYTVLCEIENRSAFVKKLNDLKHSVNRGEPSTLETGYVVIKIDYLNNDYDLLYPNAQWFHRSGQTRNGYFFFDSEQFDALISDYSTGNKQYVPLTRD